MTSDAASKTSVGVLGGEASDEKLDDIIDLGDEDGSHHLHGYILHYLEKALK